MTYTHNTTFTRPFWLQTLPAFAGTVVSDNIFNCQKSIKFHPEDMCLSSTVITIHL